MMLTKLKKAVDRVFGKRREEGFTLLEVMVSMIIFATGLLMMVPMIVTSIKSNEFADMSTRAAHFIQAKMEEIKNTHNFTSGYDNPDGRTRTWTIVNNGPNLKTITVQMDWVDQDGRPHSNVTTTYESHN
jgi:prepilin-type N-terminal cleavage/methylation domain-containing protein